MSAPSEFYFTLNKVLGACDDGGEFKHKTIGIMWCTNDLTVDHVNCSVFRHCNQVQL